MTSTTDRLRALLNRPGIIRSLGVHDVFSARVMEDAGLELLFLGGFGASASLLGLPDLELMTLTEMTAVIRRITARTTIPLVADGDTGHGELHNVIRTVRQFEQAGAAGILLEDQVSPKRCGHFAGKQVVPIDEMMLKLQAALDTRRDDRFVVMARTDALAREGIAAAIERANRYGEAGADVCFVEAPTSRGELEKIAQDVNYPLLANMLVGGTTPILPADELEALGYKIMVCPVAGLLVTGMAMRKMALALLTEGRVDQISAEMLSFEELKELLGVSEFLPP